MVGHDCLRDIAHALELNVFNSISTSSRANSQTGADLVDPAYEEVSAVLIPTSVHGGAAQVKGEELEGEAEMNAGQGRTVQTIKAASQ